MRSRLEHSYQNKAAFSKHGASVSLLLEHLRCDDIMKADYKFQQHDSDEHKKR
jgi:hypothetical protein